MAIATPEQQLEVYEKLVRELTEKRGRVDPASAEESPPVAAALEEMDRMIARYTAKISELRGAEGG